MDSHHLADGRPVGGVLAHNMFCPAHAITPQGLAEIQPALYRPHHAQEPTDLVVGL